MPTPLDRALNSKNMVLGFAALISGVAMYSIWGQDMFPREQDPAGEPETWTADQQRKFLESRGLATGPTTTSAELIAMVRANLNAPRV
ncbi:uncharacterized protein RCC_04291 [Ramularia collo-cygni]|uniref:STE24 endopeptidase n=1 Tax=Ramularia collo-cygni TaxID=112498 RepID=A0A2D3V4I1_9PEZI|nr:uncharacterized protein RCC_04291 [Ramularia collo-cygni]CZT18446.1 uncharacterized protein RCC_04291 [Ramularia collo-cygni]